ncbi:MAG: hypothetical protein M5R36_08770 [Deltaproteobacteria bacterium]|nr:hypothetical protein [Deltaproteobacteria bacterium]
MRQAVFAVLFLFIAPFAVADEGDRPKDVSYEDASRQAIHDIREHCEKEFPAFPKDLKEPALVRYAVEGVDPKTGIAKAVLVDENKNVGEGHTTCAVEVLSKFVWPKHEEAYSFKMAYAKN